MNNLFEINAMITVAAENNTNVFQGMLVLEKTARTQPAQSLLWRNIDDVAPNKGHYYFYYLIQNGNSDLVSCVDANVMDNINFADDFVLFCAGNKNNSYMMNALENILNKVLDKNPALFVNPSIEGLSPLALSVKHKNDSFVEYFLKNILTIYHHQALSRSNKAAFFKTLFGPIVADGKSYDSLYEFASKSGVSGDLLGNLRKYGAHLLISSDNLSKYDFPELNDISAFSHHISSGNEGESSSFKPLLLRNREYWTTLLSYLVTLHKELPMLCARHKRMLKAISPDTDVITQPSYNDSMLLTNIGFYLQKNKVLIEKKYSEHHNNWINSTRIQLRSYADFDETRRSRTFMMNAVLTLPLIAACVVSYYYSIYYMLRWDNKTDKLYGSYPQCMGSNCYKVDDENRRFSESVDSSSYLPENYTEMPSALHQHTGCHMCGAPNCGNGTTWATNYTRLQGKCEYATDVWFGLSFVSIVISALTLLYMHYVPSLTRSAFGVIKAPANGLLHVMGEYSDVIPIDDKANLVSALKLLFAHAVPLTTHRPSLQQQIVIHQEILSQTIDKISAKALIAALGSASVFITDYALSESMLGNLRILESELKLVLKKLPGSVHNAVVINISEVEQSCTSMVLSFCDRSESIGNSNPVATPLLPKTTNLTKRS